MNFDHFPADRHTPVHSVLPVTSDDPIPYRDRLDIDYLARSHADRTDLLIPDPPSEDNGDGSVLAGGVGPTLGPINPLPLPGYDEPDENEDGLDC